ncbi:MAG: hypothetical protein ACYDCK_08955 [Thermoplasmatota archaeon]
MVEPTLYVSALFGVVSAAVYAYVGGALSQRRVSQDAQLASTMFSVWWFGLAGVTLESAALALAAGAGIASVQIFLALTYVALIVLVVALWGLVYYLVYLYTGSRRAFWPIAVFYAAVLVGLVYFISTTTYDSVQINRWNASLHAVAQPTGIIVTILTIVIIAPEFLGAVAYGSYYFRVEGKTQKFRIAVVSLSLIVWFGTAALASAAGIQQSDSWQVTSKLIGLVASLAILFAYLPPKWFSERFGIDPVERRPAPPAAQAPPRAGPIPSLSAC